MRGDGTAAGWRAAEDIGIRRAEASDLYTLVAIYNYYVEHTPTTFDVTPFSPDERRAWLEQFALSGRHQLFVAVSPGDAVVGYACSHPFRPKAAYASSVETSVYCAPGATGRRIGSRLYHALFHALVVEDVHRAYAAITLPNAASIALHESVGFKPLATYSQVGRKLGRYWDVLWMEKAVDGRPPS